jgi:hypothetical protein
VKADRSVFLVQHVHEFPDGTEEVKLIGVHSSPANARAAVARLRLQPGFAETPKGFSIDEYDLDLDHWAEGYVAV